MSDNVEWWYHIVPNLRQPLLVINYHYLSLLIFTYNYFSLFIINQYLPLLTIKPLHYLPLHYLSLFMITYHYLSLLIILSNCYRRCIFYKQNNREVLSNRPKVRKERGCFRWSGPKSGLPAVRKFTDSP